MGRIFSSDEFICVRCERDCSHVGGFGLCRPRPRVASPPRASMPSTVVGRSRCRVRGAVAPLGNGWLGMAQGGGPAIGVPDARAVLQCACVAERVVVRGEGGEVRSVVNPGASRGGLL